MKLKHLPLILAVLLPLWSCSTNTEETPVEQEQGTLTSLTLDFTTTTETAWEGPSSRALSAGDAAVTRIALTVLDAQNNKTLELTQRKDDTGFGSFSNLRLLPGTYTFVVVAHKGATTDEGFATITSAESATLPGSYFLDTYTATKSVTIEANASQEVSITVPLCVSRLIVTNLDAVPTDATTIQVTINSGKSALSSLTFNPSTGLLADDAAFSRAWNITSVRGQSNKSFSVYMMAKAFPLTADVKIETFDSEGNTIASRTLSNITFNRAKVRSINSYFFSGATSTSLEFEEWSSEDPITIE